MQLNRDEADTLIQAIELLEVFGMPGVDEDTLNATKAKLLAYISQEVAPDLVKYDEDAATETPEYSTYFDTFFPNYQARSKEKYNHALANDLAFAIILMRNQRKSISDFTEDDRVSAIKYIPAIRSQIEIDGPIQVLHRKLRDALLQEL